MTRSVPEAGSAWVVATAKIDGRRRPWTNVRAEEHMVNAQPMRADFRRSPAGPDGEATRPERLTTASCSIYTFRMSKRTMQEATFLILTALAGGSQHGYGIITDVEQISKRLADEAARLHANAHAATSRLDLRGGVATT